MLSERHKAKKARWPSCTFLLGLLILLLLNALSSKEALHEGPAQAQVASVEFTNEAPLERLQFQGFEKVRNQPR